MKSKFSDDIFVMWQVQRSGKSGEWVNAGRAFETRRAARAKAKELREGTHTFDQGNGKTVIFHFLGGEETRTLRVVVERNPRSMMPRPCAPSSYADSRTVYGRAK